MIKCMVDQINQILESFSHIHKWLFDTRISEQKRSVKCLFLVFPHRYFDLDDNVWWKSRDFFGISWHFVGKITIYQLSDWLLFVIIQSQKCIRDNWLLLSAMFHSHMYKQSKIKDLIKTYSNKHQMQTNSKKFLWVRPQWCFITLTIVADISIHSSQISSIIQWFFRKTL